jgi:hypothetical protein
MAFVDDLWQDPASRTRTDHAPPDVVLRAASRPPAGLSRNGTADIARRSRLRSSEHRREHPARSSPRECGRPPLGVHGVHSSSRSPMGYVGRDAGTGDSDARRVQPARWRSISVGNRDSGSRRCHGDCARFTRAVSPGSHRATGACWAPFRSRCRPARQSVHMASATVAAASHRAVVCRMCSSCEADVCHAVPPRVHVIRQGSVGSCRLYALQLVLPRFPPSLRLRTNRMAGTSGRERREMRFEPVRAASDCAPALRATRYACS